MLLNELVAQERLADQKRSLEKRQLVNAAQAARCGHWRTLQKGARNAGAKFITLLAALKASIHAKRMPARRVS